VSGTALDEMAAAIVAARAERRPLVAPFLGRVLPAGEAYGVQARVTAIRSARGERHVGWKLGYTSAAMREQMGIDEPNFGPLTDAMVLPDGASVPDDVIQPRVEPEIALVLGSDVRRPFDASGIRPLVARARAALEVVDSVWLDYRFSWAENTADGSSAAYVVLGDDLPLTGLDELAVGLLRNGESVGTGVGAAAMGDPLAALSWLGARLLERGRFLAAGEVVITGGLVRATPLAAGDVVSARIGDVTLSVGRAHPAGDGRHRDGILSG
jgi:2-keto-4-pentenoate hydratase